MSGLGGLVPFLVKLLLARAQQLLCAAAGAAAAARALATPAHYTATYFTLKKRLAIPHLLQYCEEGKKS